MYTYFYQELHLDFLLSESTLYLLKEFLSKTIVPNYQKSCQITTIETEYKNFKKNEFVFYIW